MRPILSLAVLLLAVAACDSPTAPRPMADGSVRFSDLNPQPLPPGLRLSTSSLNPQPLPPGRSASLTTSATCIAATTLRTAGSSSLYEPPDPCLR